LPQISHAATPHAKRCAPADRSSPRHHHRARGRRDPAAARAPGALPGDALRRRRGRGRREEWWLAALGFVPPYRSRERSGRNVFFSGMDIPNTPSLPRVRAQCYE
jgi:hypothetical protein